MTGTATDLTASRTAAAAQASFPRILGEGRRALFARLVANGTIQGGAAIALAFLLRGAGAADAGAAIAGIAALGALVVALRMAELGDAERLGLDYVTEIRLRLYDGIVSGRRTSHGVAMARMMNDLSALRQWAGLGVARSVTASLALAGCLLAAASFSPGHLAAIAIPLAVIALGAGLAARPLLARVGEVRRERGRLAALLGEALTEADMLRTLGAVGAMRGRIATASERLARRLMERIRVAACLRALPDALVPGAVIAALLIGLPLEADAVGLVLLAGLATGPVRQLLRIIEYRAAFRVGRARLGPALGRAPASDHAPANVPVSDGTPVLGRSLRRNIDLARRHRGDDAMLRRIARDCRLLDPGSAPRGLASRLDPDHGALDGRWRARLAVARAIAAGAPAVVIEAPALFDDPEGVACLDRAAARHGLTIMASAAPASAG